MSIYWNVTIACFALWGAVKFLGTGKDSRKDTSSRRRVWRAHHKAATIHTSGRLAIAYSNRDGEITSREITVIDYRPALGHIGARCHLRKASRTFRIDRISKAVDLDTGEVVTWKLDTYLRARAH